MHYFLCQSPDSSSFLDQMEQVLNQNDPKFDFGSNLETFDSMSSLDHVGVADNKPADDAGKKEDEHTTAQTTPPPAPQEAEPAVSEVPQPTASNGVGVSVEVEVLDEQSPAPKQEGM